MSITLNITFQNGNEGFYVQKLFNFIKRVKFVKLSTCSYITTFRYSPNSFVSQGR
jgi:hypothetical protein